MIRPEMRHDHACSHKSRAENRHDIQIIMYQLAIRSYYSRFRRVSSFPDFDTREPEFKPSIKPRNFSLTMICNSCF